MRAEQNKRKSEITKENLFHAAYALFNEKGYDNVSIKDISEYAGIKRSGFYYYFPSKEALMDYSYEVADAFYQNAYELSKNEASFDEKLRIFLTSTYTDVERFGRGALKANLKANLDRNDTPFLNNRHHRAIIQEIYNVGIDEHVFTNPELHDFQNFYMQLMMFLVGCEYMWSIKQNDISLAAFIDSKIRIFIHGL